MTKETYYKIQRLLEERDGLKEIVSILSYGGNTGIYNFNGGKIRIKIRVDFETAPARDIDLNEKETKAYIVIAKTRLNEVENELKELGFYD